MKDCSKFLQIQLRMILDNEFALNLLRLQICCKFDTQLCTYQFDRAKLKQI